MTRLRLIDDWTKAWKFASIRLAAIAAALAGVFTANQSLLLSVIGMLPGGYLRYVAAGVIAACVFIIPALSRVVEKCDDGTAN